MGDRVKTAAKSAGSGSRFFPRLPRAGAIHTLFGSPKARAGFVIVMFFVLAALLAPVLAPGDPKEFVGATNQPPSSHFWLGTNPQGKDVFRQLIWGGRLSLLIGFGSGGLMIVIATVIGMIAGYFRGLVDDVLNFVMNLFLVIPGLPLLVVLSAYLKPGTATVIFALAFTGWAYNARIIRAQTMSLREKDFVAAAVVSGEPSWRVIFVHIMPNMVNIIVGGFIGAVIYGIMASTGLAFLGLASTQDVTWGTNLFWAQNGGALIIGAWWAFIPSGLAVALVAFGLALINYGMDEITNPRLIADREVRSLVRRAHVPRMQRATPVVRAREVSTGDEDQGPRHGEGEALLAVRHLYVEYLTRRGPAQAVSDVSFDIHRGEVFGLAGESGCGKSTIAHAILRVLRPPAVIRGGQVLFAGTDILKLDDRELQDFRWARASMVFQSAMNSLNPVMRVGDQITDVLVKHQHCGQDEARERAAQMLEIVGIEKGRLEAFPHQLSGGMRQRVVIAIALALQPELIIMDEPTTALDVVVQRDILQHLQELRRTMGFSVLFITHDVSTMVEFSDQMAIMYAGEIVEKASAEEIFQNPLHPYTQGLLRSFPSLRGEKRKLSGIPGSPPDLVDPPKGCKFHPRCTVCTHKETEKPPRLTEVLPGHFVAVHEGMPLPDGVRLAG